MSDQTSQPAAGPQPRPLVPLTKPALVAVALESGGRLIEIPHDPGRVIFLIGGLPEDWHDRLARDEIKVSALGLLGQLERVLSLVKVAQQRRWSAR